MAGGKETPRQKMIGMMYLVLTALLALNVSKEVLNSFILINDSLVLTNQNFTGKNQSQYSAFGAALANDEQKVRPYYNKAMEVKASADSLYNHIEELKQYLIMKTDKLDSTAIKSLRDAGDLDSINAIFALRNLNSKDNYDTPTNIMIGGEEGVLKEGEWTAKQLMDMLTAFKNNAVAKIDPKNGEAIIESLNKNFNTDTMLQISDSEKQNWAMANFYHIPLAAVVTNLSKIQTDVRNAESDVVKYLYGEVDASDFKFDTLAAKIIAPNLVFQGDDYSAEIFVAAFSTTQNPQVQIGKVDTSTNEIVGTIDTSSVKVDRGVGTYTVKASGEGLKTYEGIVKVKAPSGKYLRYPFKGEYMVMKSGVVVSPTKMNVLYRGVKNPISISVPGIAPNLVKATLSGGSLRADTRAGQGNYIAEIKGGGGTAKVSVSAEIDGSMRKMGDFEFRVKNVPPPTPTIAGVEGGLISANRLAAAPTVIPKMKDFDFELFYKVTKFDIVFQVGTDLITTPVNGSRIPNNVLDQIKRLKGGSRVYIENAKAVMLDENNQPAPGVTPVSLSPMSLKLQ